MSKNKTNVLELQSLLQQLDWGDKSGSSTENSEIVSFDEALFAVIDALKESDDINPAKSTSNKMELMAINKFLDEMDLENDDKNKVTNENKLESDESDYGLYDLEFSNFNLDESNNLANIIENIEPTRYSCDPNLYTDINSNDNNSVFYHSLPPILDDVGRISISLQDKKKTSTPPQNSRRSTDSINKNLIDKDSNSVKFDFVSENDTHMRKINSINSKSYFNLNKLNDFAKIDNIINEFKRRNSKSEKNFSLTDKDINYLISSQKSDINNNFINDLPYSPAFNTSRNSLPNETTKVRGSSENKLIFNSCHTKSGSNEERLQKKNHLTTSTPQIQQKTLEKAQSVIKKNFPSKIYKKKGRPPKKINDNAKPDNLIIDQLSSQKRAEKKSLRNDSSKLILPIEALSVNKNKTSFTTQNDTQNINYSENLNNDDIYGNDLINSNLDDKNKTEKNISSTISNHKNIENVVSDECLNNNPIIDISPILEFNSVESKNNFEDNYNNSSIDKKNKEDDFRNNNLENNLDFFSYANPQFLNLKKVVNNLNVNSALELPWRTPKPGFNNKSDHESSKNLMIANRHESSDQLDDDKVHNDFESILNDQAEISFIQDHVTPPQKNLITDDCDSIDKQYVNMNAENICEDITSDNNAIINNYEMEKVRKNEIDTIESDNQSKIVDYEIKNSDMNPEFSVNRRLSYGVQVSNKSLSTRKSRNYKTHEKKNDVVKYRRISLVSQPQVLQNQIPGVRRSQRIKIPPLKWWAGERIEYSSEDGSILNTRATAIIKAELNYTPPSILNGFDQLKDKNEELLALNDLDHKMENNSDSQNKNHWMQKNWFNVRFKRISKATITDEDNKVIIVNYQASEDWFDVNQDDCLYKIKMLHQTIRNTSIVFELEGNKTKGLDSTKSTEILIYLLIGDRVLILMKSENDEDFTKTVELRPGIYLKMPPSCTYDVRNLTSTNAMIVAHVIATNDEMFDNLI